MRKMISIDDLRDLEVMMSKCASGALRHARLGSEWMTGWRSGEVRAKLDDDIVMTLMRCYSKSEFALKENIVSQADHELSEEESTQKWLRKEKYESYIEHNFRQCVNYLLENCANQQHFDLILPVLFFSLILQNESNPQSVSRRAIKIDTEGKESTPWKYRNPFNLSPLEITEDRAEQDFQSTIINLESYVVKHSYYGHPIFSDKISNALTCTLRLENQYSRIKHVAEHAKIGMFIYDILTATHDYHRPINTILRMYMVMELHKTFDWTRIILSGNPEDELVLRTEGLLVRFFAKDVGSNTDYLQWMNIPLYYRGNCSTPNTKEYLNSKIKVREMFIEYYRFLNANFDWEINGFVEHFLNPRELEKYVDIDRKIIAYAKVMRTVIKALPQFEVANDIGEIISDLDQIFSVLFYN